MTPNVNPVKCCKLVAVNIAGLAVHGRPYEGMKLYLKMYCTLAAVAAVVLLFHYFNTTTWPSGMYSGNAKQSLLRERYCNKELIYKPYSTLSSFWNKDLPRLYIITPTYRRPEQLAELTRLAQTLMLVPNICWLVIEDAQVQTPLVTELLLKTGIWFEHLTAPMPEKYKQKKKPLPKGVASRNKGLEWVKQHAKDGVIYFADDDNTYSLEIFCEMRFTVNVSMWPVGLVTKLGVSSPIVRNNAFDGFYDGWKASRKFPVDMAGFAVSVKFLLQRPKSAMPFMAGYEEDGFLQSLQPLETREIELLASNCTKILVWHTQSKKNKPSEPLNETMYKDTNIVSLKKIIV